MIAILSITCIVLLVIWQVIRKYKFRAHLKCFPKAKGWPIIGILPDFLDPDNAITTGLKLLKDYGPNVFITVGVMEVLLLTEPKFNEIILGSSKLIDKAKEYKLSAAWIGDGLLVSSGLKWKSRRKILTPGFHYSILQDFVQVFNKVSDKLVQKLSVEVGKDSFDVYRYINLHTLDLVCETAMGISVNAQDDENSVFVQSVKTMCDLLYRRLFSIISRVDWLYRLTPAYRKEKCCVKILNDYSDCIIKKRRNELLGSNEVVEQNFGMKTKNTFLDLLLKSTEAGKPLTDGDIRDEVNTFIFEGHDTTAGALSYCLHALSKDKDVQEKLYEEIKTTLDAANVDACNFEQLTNMKYLEMVIKETLRLCPSVPVMARTLSEDTYYDGGMLPKGLMVALAPLLTHRIPSLYPDPHKFDPERFSNENHLNRHPYAYIPFSAGPRNCIGQKFAMLALKATISKILMQYEILPVFPEHNVHLICKVTMQSANGFNIQLKQRK